MKNTQPYGGPNTAGGSSSLPLATPGLLFTALLPASLWGINNVAIAVASAGIPVATFNAVRSLLAVIALFGWLLLQKRFAPAALDRGLVLRWLLLGGIGLGLFQLLLVLSIRVNGPAIMAVLATLSQVLALVYERRVENSRLGRREIAVSLMALVGVCVIFLPELLAVDGWNPWGLVYGLAAPVCWAAYSIGSRGMVPKTGPLISTGLALSGAALVLIPLAVGEWRAGLLPAVGEISLTAWGAFLITIFVGACLSNFVWLRVLQRVGPARALLASYVLPVVTTVLSVILLGEVLNVFETAGSVLVISGVALVRPPKVTA